MVPTNRFPLITLGWQTWSILAVVFVLVIAAAAFLLFA
jgi:hypothetical protein